VGCEPLRKTIVFLVVRKPSRIRLLEAPINVSYGAGNINKRGTAVGVADTATPDLNYPNFNPLINAFGPDPFIFHAFGSTDGGALVDLGALPGTNSSSPIRIGANGLIVGTSVNGTIDPLTGWPAATAVLWKDGQITNLGTLGGYESEAFSVNSHGQVIGFSGNTVSDPYSILGLGTETDHTGPGGGGESRLKNPLREICTVGSVRGRSLMSHGGLKRARSWKRRIQPKEAYSSPGLLYSQTSAMA
jgi:uncharacterized membrane protein